MTPPIAPLPYKVLADPRTTSMRSMLSTDRSARSIAPPARLIFTPSTNTTVWSELLPRMKMPVVAPSAPVRTTSNPGTLRSASATVRVPCLAMSSALMTLTERVVRLSRSAERVAVMISGSSRKASSSCCAQAACASSPRTTNSQTVVKLELLRCIDPLSRNVARSAPDGSSRRLAIGRQGDARGVANENGSLTRGRRETDNLGGWNV